MALTIGYDGKFLWQGKNLGSRALFMAGTRAAC